jgi:hypothetical protein
MSLSIGVVIGAILVSIFSAFDPTWVGDAILSGMTYGGFAFIIFGFLYKKNGAKNFIADFFLGVGIGLILVWFIGAGNGTITSIDLNY